MFLDPQWTKILGTAVLVLFAPSLLVGIASGQSNAVITFLSILAAIPMWLAGKLLVYSYFSRIVAMIAREGRDLPLPPWMPIEDQVVRGVKIVIFWIVLAVTMVPLLCIVICPIAASLALVDSENWLLTVSVFLLVTGAVTFTVGLIGGAYALIGLSRFLVTDDFGSGINPGEIFRQFRRRPGDWLIAAFFPVLLSFCLSVGYMLLSLIVPSAGGLGDVAVSLISEPVTLYGMLVGFHLAGQAYATSEGHNRWFPIDHAGGAFAQPPANF
jgi:hypothetical protein